MKSMQGVATNSRGAAPAVTAAAPPAAAAVWTPAEHSRGQQHVPALDGVRGLAILLVLFFHFLQISGSSTVVRLIQKSWGFGWMGVDLFFVLSGFLITGILFDAKQRSPSASHYFRNFYARRTVRIFPLYFAFLALFLLVLPRVLGQTHVQLFGAPPVPQWWYWLYVYNWHSAPHDPATFSHTLGVTWSLCIEEQFYLVWPAVVLLCSARGLLRACVAVVAMSLLWRLGCVMLGYVGLQTDIWSFARMEGLATGAALAVMLRTRDLRPLVKPAWALVVLVPVLTVGLNVLDGSLRDSKVYRVVGYTTLAAMFGSLLLVTITSPSTSPLVRFFSSGVMRTLGKYSYAIYLFNQPIKYTILAFVFDPDTQGMVLGSKVPAQLAFFLLVTFVTLGVAWLSWNLFEKHFLKLKVLFPMDARSGARPARDGQPDVPVDRGAGVARAAQ